MSFWKRPQPVLAHATPTPEDRAAPLDPASVRAEHARLTAEIRKRGVDDATRHQEDLLRVELPIGSEVSATGKARLEQLTAAREEAVSLAESMIATTSALLVPARSALAAVEAALRENGVNDSQVALPPLDSGRAAAGSLARLLGWLFARDSPETPTVRRLRATRTRLVVEIADLDRRLAEERERLDRLQVTAPRLAHSELALIPAQVAAYEGGVVSGLPRGALDRGERPKVAAYDLPSLPVWAVEMPLNESAAA